MTTINNNDAHEDGAKDDDAVLLQRPTEDLLAFPIDVRAVLAHMKQDMRDDWFPDPIEHRDLYSNIGDLKRVILSELVEGNGLYEGNYRHLCDIPKKGLGIRYSLETDFYDRFVYQAISSFLIPYFDPLLSPRALGHRYNARREKEKYLYKPRIELWQTFEGVTYTAISSKQALLATDVLNYFENISIDLIRQSFESMLPNVKATGPEKSRIRNAITSLCLLLERWCYSERHGLPQNRDPSSFIANVVLNTIDQRMVELGYDYYRYVDDIRIVCTDDNAARKSLIELINQLRTVGMNINSSKTKILNSASTSETIAEFFPTSDDRSVAIDNMWKSRSRRIVARSAVYIAEMIKDCINDKVTQSRQFRFAVNRLIQLVDARLFDLQSRVARELVDLIIQSLPEHPASTDQYARLLGALAPNSQALGQVSRFLADSRTAIHSWQNYHLWLVLARHKFKSAYILSYAEERISQDILSPEVSAIFIYLACVEEQAHLARAAEKFSGKWPFRHQRHYLLAAKFPDQETQKNVGFQLGVKLKNTAKRAAPYFSAQQFPLIDREAPTIAELYDQISSYD